MRIGPDGSQRPAPAERDDAGGAAGRPRGGDRGRRNLAAELDRRLRQQERVADFALQALRSDNLEQLLVETCRHASEGLDAGLAKVLQHDAPSGDFLLRASVGPAALAAGLEAGSAVGSGRRSPAGEAYRTMQPVVCVHGAPAEPLVDAQARPAKAATYSFRLPRTLEERGVLSAIVVPIQDGRPFGVLEVDSTRPDAFTAEDAAFLRGLANILGAVIEKRRRLLALRHAETFATAVLDACPDCVEVLDPSGTITSCNTNGLRLLGCGSEARIGRDWQADWSPGDGLAAEGDDGLAAEALARAREGGIGRFTCARPTGADAGGGQLRWWDVLVAPFDTVRSPDSARGQPPGFVAVARDISEQVQVADARDQALREKDLMMLEVHHRVKNSLQLVQNLLSLQSRASGDEDTAAELAESAARVHTIAAIHDRLYRSGVSLTVEIGPYLQGLIEDLEAALASTMPGRRMLLDASPATWPAADVATLGLVLTELITNSLKYGEGTVRIVFRQQAGEQATLSVDDEGPGPGQDFEPTRSRGLGMRLVTGLLRGADAGLDLDRSGPRVRFVARFPLREGQSVVDA